MSPARQPVRPARLARTLLLSTLRCVAVGALALCAGSCTIDTELGVAADFRSATIRVSGADATTVVAVDLVVDFRVGEHAQGGDRRFIVTTAGMFIDMAPVADVRVDDSRTLSPGDSTTVTLTGESRAGAFPAARDQLCSGSPTVQVLIQWSEETVLDPPPMMMFDMEDFTTTSIVCE